MNRAQRCQSGSWASQFRRHLVSSVSVFGAVKKAYARRRSKRPGKNLVSVSSDVQRSTRTRLRCGLLAAVAAELEIVGTEQHASGKKDLSGEVGAGGIDSTLMHDRSGI